MDRTIDWDGEAIVIVDQCALPHSYRTVRLSTVDELIEAIRIHTESSIHEEGP